VREILYIRLRDPLRAIAAYAIANPDAPASILVRTAPLEEILQQALGRRLILLVPASEVRLTQVDVPSRQPSKALQAAPFILEDRIAEDVEALHFALGPRQAAGHYPVALTAQSNMENWLAPLRAAGLMPDAVIPETLCLPPPAGDAYYVLAEPDQVIVRNGAYSGYCCASEDLPFYLQTDGEAMAPATLRVLMSADVPTDFSTLDHAVELRAGYSDPLEALIRHYRPEQAINLLQGRYSRRESLARLWRPWRLTAALALAVFLTAVMANGIWAWRLDRAAWAQDAANTQRFRQAFPDEPTSLALSLALQQKESQLSGGGKHSGLLQLLQQIALGLKVTGGLKVSDLQFRDDALFADLTGTDLQALEKLRDWFKSHPGTRMDVQTANSNDGSVQIRIKLSAA